MANRLFYGDNLAVLRGRDADGRALIPDESVDLVYLDPPFNSAATYNVLFRAPDGSSSDSQMEAFEDSWHWGDSAAQAYDEVLTQGTHTDASVLLRGVVTALGKNDMTAYLSMMAVRLIELHRVLKPTGSLYLHCDPTAGHYLKIILDGIFGPENFRNEIVWRRTNSHNSTTRQLGPIHDLIFLFSKSDSHRIREVHTPHLKAYIAKEFRYFDDRGRYRVNEIMGPGVRTGDSGKPWRGYDPTPRARHWAVPESLKVLLPNSGRGMSLTQQLDALDALGEIHISASGRPKYKQRVTSGVPLQDIWSFQPGTEGCIEESSVGIDQDVKWLDSEAERLGYPTQKPLGLLERIIRTSSDPGDVVLDPFCGCGTAVHAAQKLGRQWIGIDVTHLAISLVERRLKDAFEGIRFEVLGTPKDLAGARDLAARDKHQFQWWAVSLLEAVPQGGKKKGADHGIDGIRWVRTGPREGDLDRVVVSVKGGANVGVGALRDLVGTVQREGALGGVLVTLEKPTRPMLEEAAKHGFASTGLGQFRKILVYTVAELMAGVHTNDLPPLGRQEGFRRAPKERAAPRSNQAALEL